MSHYNQLIEAFKYEWANRPANPLLERCEIINDTPRYWWVDDHTGRQIIQWECRRFPGCDTLIITTKVELRDDLRGRGLGRYFRELRHRAYKRAGFVGELATVRADNAAQNRLMVGSVPMGEFRSDFGGTYKLWLTNLLTSAAARPAQPQHEVIAEASRRAREEIRAIRETRQGPGFLERNSHADLDAIAVTPPTVQPLPGDGVGLLRNASPIRPPITVYSHWPKT